MRGKGLRSSTASRLICRGRRKDQQGGLMAILKRTLTLLAMGGATAAVIGLSTAPAFSATTFTVKPGGAITAKAGKTTLKDKNTGSTLSCASSSGKGSVKSGKGLSGNGIGKITSLGFSNCT